MSEFRNQEGTKNVEPRVDVSGTLVMISYAHDACHRNILVQATEGVTGQSVARDYLIRPPTTHDFHMHYRVDSSVGILFELFEGPTLTGDGAPITRARFNRKGSTTLLGLINVGPTVSATGTKLQSLRNGGAGAGPTRAGGSVVLDDAEWVMKAGIDYLPRVTPDASASWGISFEYYEVAI